MTNELPRLNDSSGALAGRFVILPMTHSFFGQEDHFLKERLAAEYPGILNWALAGYLRLRERGYLVQAAAGIEAMRDVEELASPITAFIARRCDLSGEVPFATLYRAWQDDCVENGLNPTAANIFGRDLRAAVPSINSLSVGPATRAIACTSASA